MQQGVQARECGVKPVAAPACLWSNRHSWRTPTRNPVSVYPGLKTSCQVLVCGLPGPLALVGWASLESTAASMQHQGGV